MIRAGIVGLVIVVAGSASAQDQPAAAAPKPPEGILPVPDYSGDIETRRFLSGDWGGSRTEFAEKGVQIELDWNQYLQGVVDGGRDRTTQYGGKGNLLAFLDLQRMGLVPGALVKFRGESRYGESVNEDAGPILPVNTDAFFPLTDDLDDDIPFAVTNLVYTQFLSEKFGLFLGKIDTLDGDANEFASGRGTTQFMNSNFVFNSTLGLRLPYATLGAGVVWMPDPHVTVTSSVINTVDSSTTTGFDDFGDGNSWTTEANFQYRLADLPGGQNVGVLYSFDQDFTKIGGRLIFEEGEGLSLETEEETWAVYWSGWQYVCVEDPSDAIVSLADGAPDHQGLGLYARAGFADEDTNPVEWSLSGGIGGRGLIPSRDGDTLGLGYYYTSLQTGRLSGITDVEDAVQGLEAFYDVAITPAAHLTLDAQLVESANSDVDDAVVLGLRLALAF